MLKYYLLIGILLFSERLFSQASHNVYLNGTWNFTVNADNFSINFIDTIHCSVSKSNGKLTSYIYKFSFDEKSNKGVISMYQPGKQQDENYLYFLRRLNSSEYKILERGYTATYYSEALLDHSDSTNTGNLKKENDH